MASDKPIRRIAIVGTGVIGASWAAEFLARGFDVVATDPAPNAEANLRKYVDAAWPALTAMGLSQKASRERLSFTLDMKTAVSRRRISCRKTARNGRTSRSNCLPTWTRRRPPIRSLRRVRPGITMSVMQSACKHPERCVIGHPFNPPHMIPLVEVVGGAKTSPETVQRAIDFYASIGKKPIHLRKEVVGHVANRLQAALYREVVNLIHLGVLDVADADTAVCWGPGLRWGVMGPEHALPPGRRRTAGFSISWITFRRSPGELVERPRQLYGMAGRKQANHH